MKQKEDKEETYFFLSIALLLFVELSDRPEKQKHFFFSSNNFLNRNQSFVFLTLYSLLQSFIRSSNSKYWQNHQDSLDVK